MKNQLDTFDDDFGFSAISAEEYEAKITQAAEKASAPVEDYKQKYEKGDSPYDSPYYYKSDNYYIVKNKSSGKSLKSINYTPVKLNIDELTVV